ncbi:ubiquitin domain-containing protein UBFD1 [Trichonephila inaurata madagascariensis]|uniref:Ubiquitin domain-containing protein UBFD1 n=1 Tax=Trichonephila inaurata madagascariensis TaxID=2747483 RepID=A0A8X6YL87_9ARAC|nr:ubiquitin domain-containing protein UBFD1 [Trichonephila inaurata madagascariensis]
MFSDLGEYQLPLVKHFINTGDHQPFSTTSYRLSPNRKELLRKEIDNLLADLYQKQVEKGGIIDIEAGKNKYLLEISNAPTGGNTAENSVPDEANDVNATPETDSSTKPEENASVMPKDRASGSKDMRISSGNEPRNKGVRYDGRTKNDRYGYNKQPRGNSNGNNSYRRNQRFNNYPKPNEQHFNQFKNRAGYSPGRFDVEEHYTEGNYLPQNKTHLEDYSAEARHDASPVTDLSPLDQDHTFFQIKGMKELVITIRTDNMMGKRKGISISPFQSRHQREKVWA